MWQRDNQSKQVEEVFRYSGDLYNKFLSILDSDKFEVDFKVEGNSNYAFILILKEANFQVRDQIEKQLNLNGIEFRRGLSGGGNQLRQPYLKNLVPPMHFEEFKNTEHIHFYGFYIGNFPSMSLNEVDEICEVLNKV